MPKDVRKYAEIDWDDGAAFNPVAPAVVVECMGNLDTALSIEIGSADFHSGMPPSDLANVTLASGNELRGAVPVAQADEHELSWYSPPCELPIESQSERPAEAGCGHIKVMLGQAGPIYHGLDEVMKAIRRRALSHRISEMNKIGR